MNGFFRHSVTRAVLCLVTILCLLLTACAAAAESEDDIFANSTDEELDAWIKLLADLDESSWADYPMLNSSNRCFVVLLMPGNVLAIAEPFHEQCVFCYLILGLEKNLLLDTSTGIVNLREVVDSFSAYPLTVLNSHDHFDHIGGNAQFDEVWCYDLPSAVRHLTNGPTETEQEEILSRTKSLQRLFEYFGYEIPEKISGKAPTGTVTDGQVIDLGGRKLEVIHTPGHQPSCIMLLDRENKLLFTGDMFYRGPMYCMFDDSCFPDYVQSIRKVADLTKELGISKVYTSHNEPAADAETLQQFADFLEGIEKGEITKYETDEDGFRTYTMTGDIGICLPGEGVEPRSGYSMPDPE